ncbi:MAG: ankyrin repeat domain-containing protein, partial [Prochlorothrix sp.]|nr:ankyrin repeat domain-containing protein [Prochlorothrix sp.]
MSNDVATLSPFLQAVQTGDLPGVSDRLSQGASLEEANAEGQTALILAAEAGHREIVTYLLAQGAAVNGA